MTKRRKAREIALQLLYQLDMVGDDDPAARAADFWAHHPVDERGRGFADELVRGTRARQAEIDRLITQYAEHWELDRMAVVDRNILRLPVSELLGHAGGAPKGAVNAAVRRGN